MNAPPVATEIWAWDKSANLEKPTALLASAGIVYRNLLRGYLRPEELHPAGMRYFCMDAYAGFMFLASPKNCFAEFVLNFRWDPLFLRYLREGLEQVGCAMHLSALDAGARAVKKLEGAWLDGFLINGYPNQDLRFTEGTRMATSVRQSLAPFSAAFQRAFAEEPVGLRAGDALRNEPNLVVLDGPALLERVTTALKLISDEERERRHAEYWRERCIALAKLVDLPFERMIKARSSPLRFWFVAGGRSLDAFFVNRGPGARIRDSSSGEVLAGDVLEPNSPPRPQALDWARHWPQMDLAGRGTSTEISFVD